MITATYDPLTARVRMETGIGELRVVQTIPADQYLVRQLNWPSIYPQVVWLKRDA